MNCQKCGAPLEDGAKFCEVCGASVNSVGQQQAYQQPNNFSGGSNDDFIVHPGGNTKKIRRWFKGDRPIWPIVLIIIGIPSLTLGIVGIVFILIGAIFWYITWSTTSSAEEVDQAWRNCVNILSRRGMDKLNLIQEQVSLIDPVVLVGFGDSPDNSFAVAKTAQTSKGLYHLLWQLTLGRIFKKKDGTEDDPYEAYRIGKDDIIRSLLQEVSVFLFTDTQVLRYWGNIDISTGLIYGEGTDEIFYQDIEGINFEQELYKAYSIKKKNFVNKRREKFVLYLGGCTLSSSICMETNRSMLGNQFTAMRNLIRDKKNS